MRICYYADPGSIHNKRWIGYFASHGHDVHLICETPASLENVTTHHLEVPNLPHQLRLLFRLPRLKALINQLSPDILHAQCVTTYGYWAALAGFHPFVLTAWGSDVLVTPCRSFSDRFLTIRALKVSDLITVESEVLETRVVALGASSDKVHRLPWGVDLERFESCDGTTFRGKAGIPESDKVVLAMRNLAELYNHNVFINAARMVLKEHPKTHFLVVGEGPLADKLKDMASALASSGRIQVLGEQPHEDVPAVLAAADVFVSIPSSDSISISLLEAMASKKPVVVSDIPANRELVKDRENGLVVPVRSAEATAAAISYLLAHEDMAETFGSRNGAVAQSMGHAENMKRMETLYRGLLAQQSAQR